MISLNSCGEKLNWFRHFIDFLCAPLGRDAWILKNINTTLYSSLAKANKLHGPKTREEEEEGKGLVRGCKSQLWTKTLARLCSSLAKNEGNLWSRQLQTLISDWGWVGLVLLATDHHNRRLTYMSRHPSFPLITISYKKVKKTVGWVWQKSSCL